MKNLFDQEIYARRGENDARLASVEARIAAPSTTAPASPAEGQVWYETDTDIMWVWTGTEWRRVAPAGVAIGHAGLASGNTTSTSYVDAPGPYDVSFTKRSASTYLDLTVMTAAYASGAAGNIFFGLRINSVDYDVAQFYFNDLVSHRAFSGSTAVADGLAAGVYTARLRWRVSAGVTANSDSGDVVTVRIQEITPS